MIKNATIKSTTLGREDHGIMTFFITIQGEKGTCVAIGGYALDEYDLNTDTRIFKSESMEIISKILEVVGVDSWENFLVNIFDSKTMAGDLQLQKSEISLMINGSILRSSFL